MIGFNGLISLYVFSSWFTAGTEEVVVFSILIVLSYILYDIFYNRKKKLKEESTTDDVSTNEETDVDKTNDKE